MVGVRERVQERSLKILNKKILQNNSLAFDINASTIGQRAYMNTSKNKRQKNYRARKALQEICAVLSVLHKTGYGKNTVDETYQDLLNQLIELNINKGELNARTRKKQNSR